MQLLQNLQFFVYRAMTFPKLLVVVTLVTKVILKSEGYEIYYHLTTDYYHLLRCRWLTLYNFLSTKNRELENMSKYVNQHVKSLRRNENPPHSSRIKLFNITLVTFPSYVLFPSLLYLYTENLINIICLLSFGTDLYCDNKWA